MTSSVHRNVFISHRHEDDDGLKTLKALLERHGVKCRDYSVNSDNPNRAHDDNYIKTAILAPRIRQAGCLVVYVTSATRHSPWVEWEIEYAHKKGKRIVGVWQRGESGCDLPTALDRYADAMVGWHGESIVDAITGRADSWYSSDGIIMPNRSDVRRYSCN